MRHAHENKYCNECRQTTKHEVNEGTFCCKRCGIVKYPVRTMPKIKLPALVAC